MAIEYATWNPADKGPHVVLTASDLEAGGDGSSYWNTVRATQGKSSGKWYFEVEFTGSTSHLIFGVGTSAMILGGATSHGFPGQDPGAQISWGYYLNLGRRYYQGSQSVVLPLAVSGDIIRVKADLDVGHIYIALNGDAFDTDPLTQVAIGGGTVFPCAATFQSAAKLLVNFGASAFIYSVPSGYNSGWYEGDGVVAGRGAIGRSIGRGIGRSI